MYTDSLRTLEMELENISQKCNMSLIQTGQETSPVTFPIS